MGRSTSNFIPQTRRQATATNVDDDENMLDSTTAVEDDIGQEDTYQNKSEPPFKVQEIMEEETVQSEKEDNEDSNDDDDFKDDDNSICNTRPSFIVSDSPPSDTKNKNQKSNSSKNNKQVSSCIVPRVLLADEQESSPVTAIPPKGHEPPCSRWGHTMTAVGNDRVVLYGGQTFDDTTLFPNTLSDMYIYDLKKNLWFKPLPLEIAVLSSLEEMIRDRALTRFTSYSFTGDFHVVSLTYDSAWSRAVKRPDSTQQALGTLGKMELFSQPGIILFNTALDSMGKKGLTERNGPQQFLDASYFT
jgi:hypothetical protein